MLTVNYIQLCKECVISYVDFLALDDANSTALIGFQNETQWRDGSEVKYDNLAQGQNDTESLGCVVIGSQSELATLGWSRVNCSVIHRFFSIFSSWNIKCFRIPLAFCARSTLAFASLATAWTGLRTPTSWSTGRTRARSACVRTRKVNNAHGTCTWSTRTVVKNTYNTSEMGLKMPKMVM